VQDEIARAIAEQLKVTLGAGVKPATKNLEAYELYLKGRHLCSQRLASTVRLGMQRFQEAIDLDPQFALAYAGLADCYGILRVYGWVSAAEGKAAALPAVTKAAALAPELWEVAFSRAFYAFYYEPNWRDAWPHFQKALALNPRSPIAHGYAAIFLAMDRRPEEAIAHSTLSCQLDPLSQFTHVLAACTYHVLGRFDMALRTVRQALELQPEYLFGLWVKGLSECSLQHHQEAVETLERVISYSRAPIFMGLMGTAYARAGRPEDAQRLLDELEDRASRGEFVPASSSLAIYTGLGDVPAIRRTLAQTVAEFAPAFGLRITSAAFVDEFRSDPEVNRMLVQIFGY
jgi:tetratricopeptide (TPR) repeat protein